VAEVVAAAKAFGDVEEAEALLPLVHVFTHYKLHVLPYRVALASRDVTPDGYQWWRLEKISDAPLPAPVKKLLLELAAPSLFYPLACAPSFPPARERRCIGYSSSIE
jgi:A/G-specific adenine glycosylase